jgi:hypothetical protein
MGSIQGDDGTPSGMTPNKPYGVWGDSGSGGNGVVGTSSGYTGIAGFTGSERNDAAGVFGGGHIGVAGGTTGSNTAPSGSVGVYGTGSNNSNLGGIGVQGVSDSSIGVLGESNTSAGLRGESTTNDGVLGFGFDRNGFGVVGISNGTGVLAWGGQAGLFIGPVDVTGTLTKGSGGFKIDHPLDPANKYLLHSFVESPEMKNVYDGVVALDANGEAIVVLPAWFEALNNDFRYQLTPIGAPGPNLHIAEEISNQQFKIAGGLPAMKVCWQVTGIRQDAFAQANPLPVEQDKATNEQGHYLHPEVHGHPLEKSILGARHPEKLDHFKNIQKKLP